MEILKASTYQGKENQFPFPSDDIPTERKSEPEYFHRCAEAILSKYVNNRCALPYRFGQPASSVWELRDYAYGRNSPNKYKSDFFGTPDKMTGMYKTTMNISWRIVQVIPNVVDAVRGYLMKFKYDITTSAIDYQAIIDKETQKAYMKLSVDDSMRLFAEQVNQTVGTPVAQMPAPPPGALTPETPQDVDLLFDTGAFLLNEEASIKGCLNKTQYESGWDGIKDKIIDDLITVSIAGTHTYSKKGSKCVLTRYVDIDAAIIPYSIYNDFRDITWAGDIRRMTIKQLRDTGEFDEKTLLEIARSYSQGTTLESGFFGQVQNYYNDSFGLGNSIIDGIIVDVITCNWYGTDKTRISKITRKKEKNLALNKVSSDYAVSEKDKKEGKEVMDFQHQCIYKCSMVIGTKHIFEYGKENNMSYKEDANGYKTPQFPYKFIRTGNSSIVERCIGFADDICLAKYKQRNALKKLPPPPGIMIDKAALENVTINGVTQTPNKLMRLLSDEGYLVVDTQNMFGQQNTSARVIQPIPSDIINQLNIYQNEIEYNYAQIQRVTGINNLFAGASPAADQGLGVAKIAIESTTNAIYPIVKSYEYIFEQTMRVAEGQWKTLSTTFGEDEVIKIQDNRGLKYLNISSKMPEREYDIRIEAGLTAEDEMMLLQEIAQLRSINRMGGSGGITPSQYMLVYNMIKSGNTKQAQLVLAQMEERSQRKFDQLAHQNSIDNIQGQMASNQQTSENKIKEDEASITTKADLDLRNKLIEMKAQEEVDRKQFQRDIMLGMVQGSKQQPTAAR